MRRLSLTVSAAALVAAAGLLAACGNQNAATSTTSPPDGTDHLRPALNGSKVRQEGVPGTTSDTPASRQNDTNAVSDGAIADPADEPPAEVTLEIGGQEVPYETWHHMLLPGERFTVSANAPVRLRIDGRTVGDNAESHDWTVPDTPGVHDVRIEGEDGVEHRISLFVLQLYDGEAVLEGYRIGEYPQDAPEGLIRLTEDDMDAPVSPSFTIGQFICKQQPGHWPKFLLVSGNLLLRLEAVLTELREDELTEADSFFVMSGYRTPFYNTAIRSARLSRHMYGDAADIYPDAVGNDSVMDDLNGDGRITRADAEFLYDYAEDLFAAKNLPEGGIGAYDANAIHGPFVHIDGRGTRARWGRFGS